LLYRNQEDATLVMLTLAGEQRAYEALVIRYQNAVISAAASVTRNQFLAEDAAQDAFVTAWMKLNTLREPQKYGVWVCRIAKNCARNMIRRFRSLLPIETVESQYAAEEGTDPAEFYALAEETQELHQSIGRLPERIREIIHLYYFEGLSVTEIADRMRLSAGTVKWQLYDGRKKIRKELCAMNEKWSDTLVVRVMKKVEELKLWQVKNNKNGFEVIYRNVLNEVEELPECREKHHALADVLMRGWWWLPGEDNDALFARICEAAERGKNDEVMTFIVSREDSQVHGDARIEFVRDKQIPRLEKAGFVKALAREWFWLGEAYFRKGRTELGNAAYDKVREILSPGDLYHALIPCARRMELRLAEVYRGKSENRYFVGASARLFRYVDGDLRSFDSYGVGEGNLNSVDGEVYRIFANACHCDGYFYVKDLAVGQTYTATDGSTLTFAAENETVETPCGTFDGCRLWVVRCENRYNQASIYKTYYKEGIGIVRHEHKDTVVEARVLCGYYIAGGEGLLPICRGNYWEYTDEYDHEYVVSEQRLEVAYADDRSAILTKEECAERLDYNEDSWIDMIQYIRNEYCDHKDTLYDVSYAIARAEALAQTPAEKAHTKAACAVARRIMQYDVNFNPAHTAPGQWNFFAKKAVLQKSGQLSVGRNYRWSFEWKIAGDGGTAEEPMLYNDVYGILQDNVNCIWSDEWRAGAEPTVEFKLWGHRPIKTKIVCEACDPVTTAAGRFENCIKLSLDVGGLDLEMGLFYRGGKREYYFAEGIGIIRTVNQYAKGARTAVYELTAYEGTGTGYMPMADGFFRRYEALGLTDGFVAFAEYTCAADEDGQLFLYANRAGYREMLPPITQYTSVQSEVVESKLWDEKKYAESRLRHDINNFNILLHFMGRDSRSWAAPMRAVEWGKYQIRMIEFLADGGDIPRAWLGRYWRIHFFVACASFGCKTEASREEGYQYLERAFELYPRWAEIPVGEALEVGNKMIYGDIKLIKGKGVIRLPDGREEPFDHEYVFHPSAGHMYYGMTAPRGWEWFNPVRGEERFKKYIERAKKLTELEK